MTVNISGKVEFEMLSDLLKAFNSTPKEETLHIYFCSPDGGDTDVAEAIINFINKNKDRIEITFYGANYSSGMVIFLKTQCVKYILPDTRGMYHFCYQQLDISEGGHPSSAHGKFSIQEMKNAKTITINYLKTLSLTKKEMRDISNGKDVYFSYSRMKDLINAI